MFLGFLIWLMNISCYVPWGSDLAEEHKDPPYVHWPADVPRLCTSVFKLRNVFSDMNIILEEHKKPRNECLFPIVEETDPNPEQGKPRCITPQSLTFILNLISLC
jgi:hypothetical protein